jgi:hypothetical protein
MQLLLCIKIIFTRSLQYLGTWTDQQIPNTFSCYGDFVMDTLLMKMLPVMKQQTNLDLIPTYSYARAYKKGRRT